MFLLLLLLFGSGDILVFLTGQDEIESLAKLITDCAQHCGSGEFNLLLQGNMFGGSGLQTLLFR